MKGENMRTFKTRAFISLSLAFSSLAVLISGLVLYVAPHGRDAYWVNWTFWSLNKEQWLAWHIILGFAFLIFAVWHIVLNFKPLWSYLTGNAMPGGGWELVSAFALFALLSVGSLKYLPPFAQVLDFGAAIQEGWVKGPHRSPFPHAELMKPRKLAEKLSVDYAAVEKNAADAGLGIDPAKDLKANAADAGLSPAAYFKKIFLPSAARKKAARH